MAKTLGQLAALAAGAEIIGNQDLEIKDIEHDSRKISEGALFVCMEGVHVDGHNFIPRHGKRVLWRLLRSVRWKPRREWRCSGCRT